MDSDGGCSKRCGRDVPLCRLKEAVNRAHGDVVVIIICKDQIPELARTPELDLIERTLEGNIRGNDEAHGRFGKTTGLSDVSTILKHLPDFDDTDQPRLQQVLA